LGVRVRSRLATACIIVGLWVLSTTAEAQAGPTSTTLTRQRPWLGCWAIAMRDSVSSYQRAYVVQLDTAWLSGRDTDTLYRAWGIEGFAEPRLGVGWTPGRGRDSIEVVLIGLGGIGWRLGRLHDSLAGFAYEYYDAITAETARGPASAHRLPCRT
jgi:hypothetical protein